MRGGFVIMPILLGAATGKSNSAEGTSPIFNNLFGIEACFLMAMLIGGILCIITAFGKKLGPTARFCLTKDGSASIRCLMMASLTAMLVFGVAPAAIFVVWLAVVALIMCMVAIAIKTVPSVSYNDLIAPGHSDFEARRLLRMSGGNMSPV